MTPYYDEDGITIYHADCRDIADVWLTGDVLVTDPPYGTGLHGYGRSNLIEAIGQVVAPRTIANDLDTSVRDEILALWGDKPIAMFASPRLPEPPGKWTDRLVWDKKRPGMNGGPWRYRHEMIYVTAGFERTDDTAVSVFSIFPDGQHNHIHAKPLSLMVRLIAAAPAGVVIDPFMGSGSTLAAAKQLHRRAIGIEVEERYCEIAVQRLAQGVLDFA